MTAPWWAAFGPAQAEMSCGGGTHTLRWADGTLVAADHPDAEGELVLAALGGDSTPCVDMVRAWGRHSDDLSVLAIGPRSAADQVTIATEMLDELPAAGSASLVALKQRIRSSSGSSAGFAGPRSAPMMRPKASAARHMVARRAAVSRLLHMQHLQSSADTDDPADLLRLLALGEALQRRLSGAVAHAWSADGEHAGRIDRVKPALTAALTGRLAPAVAQWLDVDADNVEASTAEASTAEASKAEASKAEARTADGTSWGELKLSHSGGVHRVRARLPVSWLATVWAPGFAVVGGHLVVQVLDAAWPAARVLALRAPGREPAELSIRDDAGHWSVAAG